LLDPFAEILLWEKVVAVSLSEASPLFDIQGMAKSAAEAHALARVWAVKTAGYELSDEGRLFSGWQQAFETHCRKNGWIDSAAWQESLIGVIEAGHCAVPQQIWLCGFDRHTALELRLFSALQARGCHVEKWQKSVVHRSIGGGEARFGSGHSRAKQKMRRAHKVLGKLTNPNLGLNSTHAYRRR